MEYSFYIQDFETKVKKNIETDFNCKYVEFKGLLDFEVRNCYTENYAEADGVRVSIPTEPKFKANECTLKLLFLSETAQADSIAFAKFIQGRKVEYYDNFRNVYVTLLCTKSPSTGREHLYGDTKWREMSYTFTNIAGKTFTTSQIQ